MEGTNAVRRKNEKEKGQYKVLGKDICDGLEIQKSDSPAHIIQCKMYVEILWNVGQERIGTRTKHRRYLGKTGTKDRVDDY